MIDAIPFDDLAILVYESSKAQSRILQAALQNAGHCAHFVQNAEAALHAAKSGKYGIFISNIEHKDLSGLELFWRLKAEEDTCGIYCIAVTSGEQKRAVVEALDSGADDFLRKPYDEMELRARLRAGGRTVLLQRKLTRLAMTDALTGIANRRAFMERLESEVARIRRHGGMLSVIMLDIDHFKRVNDTYGHGVGDVVIQRTVETITKRIRLTDLAGRLGGEEFAVLLPETYAKRAMIVAAEMRKAQDDQTIVVAEGAGLHVTVSLGVAEWNACDKSAEEFLSRADEALYKSKETGRNRVTCAENPLKLVAKKEEPVS